MTFAKLVLVIRRRAAAMPQDVPRASAINAAAREVLKDPGRPAELVLAALVGGEGEAFDVSIPDALTPETIALLDSLAGEVLDFGRQDELARAIAAALIKRVQ